VRQEDVEFEASLDYIVSLYVKKKKYDKAAITHKVMGIS
jgi:hypothetical protein